MNLSTDDKNIYLLEKKYASKKDNSFEDLMNYIMVELMSPIEDYYLVIDLLLENYIKYKNVKMVILGGYLSFVWLTHNEFIPLLYKHLKDASLQDRAIMYYILALEAKKGNNYEDFSVLLRKSIEYPVRFVNNYIELVELEKTYERKLYFINKAIENIEDIFTEEEIRKLSLDFFLQYDNYVNEFIIGVHVAKEKYDKLIKKKRKYLKKIR